MEDRLKAKLITLLVIATLNINLIQTLDVWTYWRERAGQKARVWIRGGKQ